MRSVLLASFFAFSSLLFAAHPFSSCHMMRTCISRHRAYRPFVLVCFGIRFLFVIFFFSLSVVRSLFSYPGHAMRVCLMCIRDIFVAPARFFAEPSSLATFFKFRLLFVDSLLLSLALPLAYFGVCL